MIVLKLPFAEFVLLCIIYIFLFGIISKFVNERLETWLIRKQNEDSEEK